MLSKECKRCKNVVWMVALGQGVRCKHPENQKYKPKSANKLPVIISYIPNECPYFKEMKNEKS